MPLSIRIDVDNPFNWHQRYQKVLNYISLNFTAKINWIRLGYLKCAHSLFDYLVKRKIPATWFFTVRTLPDEQFLAKIKENHHEIALHATHTDSWEQFAHEVSIINDKIGGNVKGFSKHGSGQLKLSKYHTPEYDEARFLEFANKADLQYFIGNGQQPSRKIKRKGNVFYWSGCFWANSANRNETRYDITWLENQVNESNIIFLIHPENWYFDKKIRKVMNLVAKNIQEFFLISRIVKIEASHPKKLGIINRSSNFE